MDNKSVIEIFSGTPWECEMIKNLLETSGIKSFLKNDILNTYAYDPIKSIKIMILNEDKEKAKGIVQEYTNKNNVR